MDSLRSSNKRIQRMAYGVSNTEVAQSTADAPDVLLTRCSDWGSGVTGSTAIDDA